MVLSHWEPLTIPLKICISNTDNKHIYVIHKNIPVLLMVNTTSHDIKYYAYLKRGKKAPIKTWMYPSF